LICLATSAERSVDLRMTDPVAERLGKSGDTTFESINRIGAATA
jgi:hypothetical protein